MKTRHTAIAAILLGMVASACTSGTQPSESNTIVNGKIRFCRLGTDFEPTTLITDIAEHIGAGVYYGAANTEAQAIIGRRVVIVGGGNSAGQSAMYLARFASEVIIVVRRDGLAASMSQYLIDQIAATPNITLCTRTEIERVEGDGRLERVTVHCLDDGDRRVEEVAAIFVFIGTRPHGEWLPDEVMRSDKGFVFTGRDASLRDGFTRSWKLEREPLPLETSVPGIFVAGDLRAGAMNRVASAVGEGAMAVKLVHEYLAMT